MAFDLIIRDVRAFGRSDEGPLVDIGISSDRIIDIRPGLGDADEIIEAGGRLVSSGLVKSNIHLDKLRILNRCSASE